MPKSWTEADNAKLKNLAGKVGSREIARADEAEVGASAAHNEKYQTTLTNNPCPSLSVSPFPRRLSQSRSPLSCGAQRVLS